YWLNPYVLLVGLWTFDAVMVALALGGLAAALRQRWLLAGVLLGAGAAVKFVPLLLVPVVLLWALRTSPRPLSALVAVSLGVLVLPWWEQVLYVLQFHGDRVGGGMSWQAIWGALAWIDPFVDLAPIYAYTSAAIGFLTLGTAVLLATWLGWLRRLDLLRM